MSPRIDGSSVGMHVIGGMLPPVPWTNGRTFIKKHYIGHISFSNTPANPTRHLGDAPDPTPGDQLLGLILPLLPVTLRIGFRLITPGQDLELCTLNHTLYHNWVFETAFSSDDDDVIADIVCAWAAPDGSAPSGLCACYFTKRVKSDTSFSPRLRQMAILAVECRWSSELEVSGFETVNLLNRLDVEMDAMESRGTWAQLLGEAICSPTGLKDLSSHYWRLLDKLVLDGHEALFPPPNVEVVRFLEEAEDWERLEIWMSAVWTSPEPRGSPMDKPTEDIEQWTFSLLSRQPSALLRFQTLRAHWWTDDALLKLCNQVQMEQLSLDEPNQLIRAQPPILVPFSGDDTF